VEYLKFRLKRLRGRGHLIKPTKDGRIILKWVLKEWGLKIWTDLYGSRQSAIEGFYKNCNEKLGSISRGWGLDFLNNEVTLGYSRWRMLIGVSWQ
jgi:hypothetical protein